jgi:hypothetical protein
MQQNSKLSECLNDATSEKFYIMELCYRHKIIKVWYKLPSGYVCKLYMK